MKIVEQGLEDTHILKVRNVIDGTEKELSVFGG